MHKLVAWLLALLACFLFSTLVLGCVLVRDIKETAKEIHFTLDRELSDKRIEAVTIENKEPISVLILGIDEREQDIGRSDSIIVMTVNPTLQSTKLISIPRDTYTEIAGKGLKDKINHAYAFGGMEMSIESVENLLNIPIDYVVQLNMDSFIEIIDAMGGVSIYNSTSFTLGDMAFPQGTLDLNGNEALAYIRMRKEDVAGDFGRQDRQRQIIDSLLQKAATLDTLLQHQAILETIRNHVRTNMTFEEMLDIQKQYRNAISTVESIPFEKGEGKRMDGIWYYFLDEAELAKVQNELQTHLEL